MTTPLWQHTFECIETEYLDGMLILRHAREDKLNARCAQMYVEIMAVLEAASADEQVVGVMLTGKGRFFSSGMDFQDDPKQAYRVSEKDSAGVAAIKQRLPERDPEDVRTWLAVKFIEAFINFDKLLIGAVNGPAIGEGFSSLLHCDVVYAADTAYFWAPFARAGVAPEFGSTYLLPERLGRTLASAAMYLGRKISVDEAFKVGFVLEIIPAGGEFEGEVMQHIMHGLALSGPPQLRGQTIAAYRNLVYSQEDRQRLTKQCHAEFELIRQNQNSGLTQQVQRYYANLLPQK